MRSTFVLVVALLLPPTAPLAAQSAAAHVALGVKAYDAVQPREALKHFEAAISADSTSYEAYWRATRAAADVALLTPAKPSPLFAAAELYARKAIALDSAKAEGHAMRAVALNASIISLQERKKSTPAQLFLEAERVIAACQTAIALDSTLDTPHRLLGVWYANLAGVRGQNRRGVVDSALGERAADVTIENGIRHLEEAARLAPKAIGTRLMLGQMYAAQKRPADARAQFGKIAKLPIATVNDRRYKQLAKAALAKLPASR